MTFLRAVGGQRVTHVLVVPRIHRGTLQDLVVRKHGQQFREGIAREALGFHRGDGGGNVEGARGLGQAHHVVLQRLAVDRLHAECHLGLLVDEDDLAVLGGQDFEVFAVRHGGSLFQGISKKGAAK